MPNSIQDAFLILILLVILWGCDDVNMQHVRRSRTKKQAYSPQLMRNHKPNIVLILTDDQDVELGSLNFMPKTLRHIRDQGAEFRHAYVTTPMCCPSRSSLLTGMYVHNHQVFTNKDNCSNAQWQSTHETRSFATYLSNAGYRTGYFGKYLNKYNGSYIPPGWREWGGLIMNSKYYNYSINMNGKKIKHGFDYSKDYYPNLIANDSITFLRNSKRQYPYKPLMLTMSFPAPHGPEDSAPEYSHLFFNVTTHHTPSYDFAPNLDKQWILRVTNRMEPIHRQFTDLLMTKRLQTLQSVDSAVETVISELEALGELENTYVIYTSDHGYHLGQFGLIKGKSFPFEFDVRVPFLVRGPGVEPGAVVNEIVLNIDLAPTFLDMAGVDQPTHMDGRSVLPLFVNPKRKKMKWPDTFLIESSGRRETPYLDAKLAAQAALDAAKSAVTTEYSTNNYFLSTESGAAFNQSGEEFDIIEEEDEEEESSDLDLDFAEETPEETANIDFGPEFNAGGDGTNIYDEVDVQLENQLPNIPTLYHSKNERLALECLSDHMKYPCRRSQRWYCLNDNGRWRKHKCKLSGQWSERQDAQQRRCACFTSTGLVYKSFPVPSHSKRIKRNTDSEISDILFNELDEDKAHNLTKREKRDALSHVENVMENVKDRIQGLTAENRTFEEAVRKATLETNAIVDNSAGCLIERGRVNCSNVIYQDKKSWRQSRHRIENEIQRLKQKLETLKEIKRHLKYTKPNNADEWEGNTTDFQDLKLEVDRYKFTTEVPLRKNKKRKRPEEFDKDSTELRPRKKAKLHIVLEGVNQSDLESTTRATNEGDIMTTTNAHRHHHKMHHTTISPSVAPELSEEKHREVPGEGTEEENNKTKLDVTTPSSSKRNNGLMSNFCHCEVKDDYPYYNNKPKDKEKQREREKKFKRKLKRQRKKEEVCHSERMNCFEHDNNHWRTEPMWHSGPFCFCMNANNNTYSCIRTINQTHNFLYCEFTTGFVTFYNLRIDPFELQNRFDQLKPEEKSFLRGQLKQLVACKGKLCTVHSSAQVTVKNRPNFMVGGAMNDRSYLKKRRYYNDDRRYEERTSNLKLNRNNTRVGYRATGVRKKRKS